jgi:hypothetical protein
MEAPSRTCPAGGVALIRESPTDPSEYPDRYWDVSCTICGHVGTTGPHVARAGAGSLAERHLTDGYRKPGIDPEPWNPIDEERVEVDAHVAAARLPGGKFYTGPITADEEAAVRRALAETDGERHTLNTGEPHG